MTEERGTTKAQVGLWSNNMKVSGLARELFPKTEGKPYDDSLLQAEAFIRSLDGEQSFLLIADAKRYRELLDDNIDPEKIEAAKERLIRAMCFHGYKQPKH